MINRGKEKPEKIKILISLTSIKNEKLTNSLLGYYCVGVIDVKSNTGNLYRAIRKLENVDNLIERIKAIDNE